MSADTEVILSTGRSCQRSCQRE